MARFAIYLSTIFPNQLGASLDEPIDCLSLHQNNLYIVYSFQNLLLWISSRSCLYHIVCPLSLEKNLWGIYLYLTPETCIPLQTENEVNRWQSFTGFLVGGIYDNILLLKKKTLSVLCRAVAGIINRFEDVVQWWTLCACALVRLLCSCK